MPSAYCEITSDKAARYMAQLCKHFAHKIPAEWEGDRGHADFGIGVCDMEVRDGRLRLTCRAPSASALARIRHIVEDHMLRFGRREGLTVAWQAPSADPD